MITQGQLIASILHDANQPLSGVITNASTCLLMLDADPPNIVGIRQAVRRIIRDGNRASEVIGRFRELFSEQRLTTRPAGLNEPTGEVIALPSRELQSDDVTVHSQVAEDPRLVENDGNDLRRDL